MTGPFIFFFREYYNAYYEEKEDAGLTRRRPKGETDSRYANC